MAQPDPSVDARIKALRAELEALEAAVAGKSVAPTAPDSSATSSAITNEALAQQLEALDQRVRVLARTIELDKEAATEREKLSSTVAAGASGFSLRSADGAFQLRIRGLLHADTRTYLGDDREVAMDNFGVRRVRPIVEATVFRRFDVRFTPDFGDAKTVIQDAYVDLRFAPAFAVRAGKFKQPLGLERLMSASELLFLERAFPTAVAPNRDIGLMAWGDLAKARVTYQLGAFDGVVDGGSTDVDDRDAKDVVGRLFVHPFRASANDRANGLGFGLAASYGEQKGTAAAPGLSSYKTTAQTFFRYRGDGTTANTVIADGARRRYSAQGYYYSGRLGLVAEQVFSSQHVRRGTATGAFGVNAWQLAGSWVLTGEKASYRSVTPKKTFEPSKGTWGAFEVAARYGRLTVDADAFPTFADPTTQARVARQWTVGANWFLNRIVKVVLDYEQVHFGSPDGIPATRPVERGFFSRVQFSF